MQESTVDVRGLIDNRPLSSFQIGILVLCALAAVLDGIDTQSIAIAAPSIAQMLGLKMTDLGLVFSIATLGAAAGALGGGVLGDRIGRKSMLVASVAVFGVFTLLTAVAGSMSQLLAIRFLAGLGLGAATPCFLALTSEYVPSRMRGAAVSLLWAGFPLGGMLGGFLNGWIIERFGWPAIFYVGGILPLLAALIILVALPESLKFLIARGGRDVKIAGIVAKLTRVPVAVGTRFVSDEPVLLGGTVKHLFTEGRALRTLCLWVPFFMGFGILAFAVVWTPTLLRQIGMSAGATGTVLAMHGLGALIGMASAGWLVDRFGAVRVLVPAFVIGAACTAALGAASPSTAYAATVMALIGLFVGGGASGAIALAALTYPTAIRSTGIGWAMGMGRIGQVVSPLLVGSMLGAGLGTGQIMPIMGVAALIAAAFVVVLGIVSRRAEPVALRSPMPG